MQSNKECRVPISVSGWIESAGLRIRRSDMMAFYISSANPDAAKYWCGIVAIQTAIERHQIIVSPGEGAEVVGLPLDWDAMLRDGKGELIVRTMPAHETKTVMKRGHRVFSHQFEMNVETWNGPAGRFMIVSDPGLYMDSWIIESAKADLKAAQQ